MWPVYRRYHLLIVGQRDDERSSAFTAAVVDVLVRTICPVLALSWSAPRTRGASACSSPPISKTSPSCRPRALRRSFWRSRPSRTSRKHRLRIIVSFGSHVLVCRPNFMARHAYLLAKTLAEHAEGLPAPAVVPGGVVPVHRGSHAFFAGEEIPND